MPQLAEDGFVVIGGPVQDADLEALTQAYDAAIAVAGPEAVKRGSTSIRVDDFVNGAPLFDAIYVHSPLLAAAREVIGEDVKLSAFHARSLRPFTSAQTLHQDFAPLPDGWPMLGFIFMVDEFRADNGATRFAKGSHRLRAPPADLDHASVEAACGSRGSMILFNGSVWHGHGANRTDTPRRSIQGALIRGDQKSAVDHARMTRPEVAARLSPTARYLLRLPT